MISPESPAWYTELGGSLLRRETSIPEVAHIFDLVDFAKFRDGTEIEGVPFGGVVTRAPQTKEVVHHVDEAFQHVGQASLTGEIDCEMFYTGRHIFNTDPDARKADRLVELATGYSSLGFLENSPRLLAPKLLELMVAQAPLIDRSITVGVMNMDRLDRLKIRSDMEFIHQLILDLVNRRGLGHFIEDGPAHKAVRLRDSFLHFVQLEPLSFDEGVRFAHVVNRARV